jgi:hypothetical protein
MVDIPTSVVEINFACNINEDFISVITITDENDNPVDISGYKARMEIRDTKQTGRVIVALSTPGVTEAGTIDVAGNGVNGEMTLKLPAAQTLLMKPSTYIYDLVFKTNETPNRFWRFCEGDFEVVDGVTKTLPT